MIRNSSSLSSHGCPAKRFALLGQMVPLIGAIGLALTVGCGGSDSTDSSESTVVTPPELVGEAPAPAESESDPPGGLELPPGAVPDASPETDTGPESGGIEMPEQTDVPADQSGANNTTPIRYGTWEEIEQLVKTSGQITVVDLWSLSCEPCLKEFPGLVRLHQEYGTSVQCVAVDLDFDGRKTRPPEYYEQRVAAFVDSVGAKFPTFISRTPSDEVYAATKLDSIPAVLIYDEKGEVVQVFADAGETVGFTYEKDVIPLVKKLAS